MAKIPVFRKDKIEDIDQAAAPTRSARILELLGGIASAIRAIKGTTNYEDAPGITLAQTRVHVDRTTDAHGGIVASTHLTDADPHTQYHTDADIKGIKNSVDDRALRELYPFLDWIDRFNAKGFIGEIGVPWSESPAEWNATLDTIYRRLDEQDIWATAWATGEFWDPAYKLQPYKKDANGAWITTPTAAVLEAHKTTPRYERGVNTAGGEFGNVSNVNPGVYGTDYIYPSQALLNFLASRGVTLIRVPFRWERIQPTLGGVLNATELTHLKDCVARAATAGLKVILDVHNYAEYRIDEAGVVTAYAIGSTKVTQAHFYDLWTRLSAEFQANATVIGYGLMNEPHRLSHAFWQTTSQGAVDAIRTQEGLGAKKLILVGGSFYSGAQDYMRNHPNGPWINDPAGNVRYEAHFYVDRNHSGTYTNTFAAERTHFDERGFRARSPERDAFIHEHSADDGSGQHLRDTILRGTPKAKADSFVVEEKGTPTNKAYRFRTGGAALDIDFGGANAYLSTFTNADFTGTQFTHIIFERNQALMLLRSSMRPELGATVNLGTVTDRFNQGFFNSLGSRSGTGDPTTTDIPTDCFALWKNTTTGKVAIWINDGGTMRTLTLTAAEVGALGRVKDEGTLLPYGTNLNLLGAGVVASKNATTGDIDVQISGASVGAATQTALGTLKTSAAPADPANPIAIVPEDARIQKVDGISTNAREFVMIPGSGTLVFNNEGFVAGGSVLSGDVRTATAIPDDARGIVWQIGGGADGTQMWPDSADAANQATNGVRFGKHAGSYFSPMFLTSLGTGVNAGKVKISSNSAQSGIFAFAHGYWR